MTTVTYTYTNKFGKKVTTPSYAEFEANRQKNTPHTVNYDAIYAEPSINTDKERRKLF